MTDQNIQEIVGKIKQLPDFIIPEIIDYVDFLLIKHNKQPIDKSPFKFDWAGALSELKDKYTSVDLQHKASEWRE